MLDKRLVIVTGHYGSGKTEFCVNYAMKMLKHYKEVGLADIDIVNPYFRSREKRDILEKQGIKVFDSSLSNTTLDIPALSSEITGLILNNNIKAIIDVGGDPVGARVLARYSYLIKKNEYDMFYVINGNRPETDTKNKVIKYLKEIEKAANLKVTGLINNTHLLKETSLKDICFGHELTEEVSWELDIPIRYEVMLLNLEKSLLNCKIKEKAFPINLYMREEWMS